MALLQRVLAAQGEGFSGVMSALYIGDVMAAILLSMRSYDVLHAWFSAYRPEYRPVLAGPDLLAGTGEGLPRDSASAGSTSARGPKSTRRT